MVPESFGGEENSGVSDFQTSYFQTFLRTDPVLQIPRPGHSRSDFVTLWSPPSLMGLLGRADVHRSEVKMLRGLDAIGQAGIEVEAFLHTTQRERMFKARPKGQRQVFWSGKATRLHPTSCLQCKRPCTCPVSVSGFESCMYRLPFVYCSGMMYNSRVAGKVVP